MLFYWRSKRKVSNYKNKSCLWRYFYICSVSFLASVVNLQSFTCENFLFLLFLSLAVRRLNLYLCSDARQNEDLIEMKRDCFRCDSHVSIFSQPLHLEFLMNFLYKLYFYLGMEIIIQAAMMNKTWNKKYSKNSHKCVTYLWIS